MRKLSTLATLVVTQVVKMFEVLRDGTPSRRDEERHEIKRPSYYLLINTVPVRKMALSSVPLTFSRK